MSCYFEKKIAGLHKMKETENTQPSRYFIGLKIWTTVQLCVICLGFGFD